jgi:hypothetical protein
MGIKIVGPIGSLSQKLNFKYSRILIIIIISFLIFTNVLIIIITIIRIIMDLY